MSDVDNPKTHSCSICGYTWLHGMHGGHSCSHYMAEDIKQLEQDNKRLRDALEHSDYLLMELSSLVRVDIQNHGSKKEIIDEINKRQTDRFLKKEKEALEARK